MIQSYENTGNSHFLSAEEREQVISLINQMKTQGSKSEKEEYSGFLQAYENRNYGSFESMPLLLKDFLSSEQMDLYQSQVVERSGGKAEPLDLENNVVRDLLEERYMDRLSDGLSIWEKAGRKTERNTMTWISI